MVFIDSSGLIAAFDARDQRHEAARRAWEQLARQRARLLTTALVFAEIVTYLRRRAGWAVARQVGETMLRSRVLEIVGIDAEALAAAWREFLRSGQPGLSLCDAHAFIIMRERGVTRALTFDDDFAQAGFERMP